MQTLAQLTYLTHLAKCKISKAFCTTYTFFCAHLHSANTHTKSATVAVHSQNPYSRIFTAVYLIAIVAIFLAIVLFSINRESLWGDEAFSVYSIGGGAD